MDHQHDSDPGAGAPGGTSQTARSTPGPAGARGSSEATVTARDALGQQLAAVRRRRRLLTALGALGLAALIVAAVGVSLVLRPLSETLPDDAAGAEAGGRSRPVPTTAKAPGTDTLECDPALDGPCPRDIYLDTFALFTREYEPALAAVSLSRWDPGRAASIAALEADALTAFETGDYPQAATTIQEAVEAADEALAQAQRRFEASLADATQAFADEDVELAQQAIADALLIAPEDATAKALAARIEVLPDVREHLEAARVAAVENRPDAEAAALRAALALDPERTSLQARLAALDRAATMRNYSAAVASAEAALARGDIPGARRALDQAGRIDPGQDLTFLRQRIDDADAQRKLTQSLSRAREARRRDDWSIARDAFATALAIDPANAEAVAGQRDAERVLYGLDKLTPYLNDPLRLGTPRVAARARELREEIAPHRDLSPSLNRALVRLEDYLEQSEEYVEVTLESDGLTELSVRRMGRIGRIDGRGSIRLKPGRYELEGRREGFVTKLVPVQVDFGATRVVVRVVCDEPAV
jgi:tetratricopeptide (TPR) repeat protein